MFSRHNDFEKFENRICLSSPTTHGDELKFVLDAFEKNSLSASGENVIQLENEIAQKIGVKNAAALSCGTSSLHLAMKVASVKAGDKVFCSDLTFDATANAIVYEGAEPVFIDSEYESWNMSPEALEKAFKTFPEVKVVVVAHLFGVPSKMDEIKEVAKNYGAYVIEDAAESLGAEYKGKKSGILADVGCLSFNANKIITGTTGGMILTDDEQTALKVKKWRSQSREKAPWYEHREIGYNYAMSNVVAGIVRGQLLHLEEHIMRKKAIYDRYKKAFSSLPVSMNPFDETNTKPNFWLSCILIDKDAMCLQTRNDCEASFKSEKGKSCPTEIIEALNLINAEARPVWKPMHLQPLYKNNNFVTVSDEKLTDVGADIFERGVCLPSDIKMTAQQQDKIIKVVKACFE